MFLDILKYTKPALFRNQRRLRDSGTEADRGVMTRSVMCCPPLPPGKEGIDGKSECWFLRNENYPLAIEVITLREMT